MEHYYNTRSFNNNCKHGYNMESYARLKIAKSEKLDLTFAFQDPHDPDIYTARYDVLDESGHTLYSLTVKLKVSTNEYSCHRSS